MQIFIMRHGEAESIAATDEARRLTERGKQQSQQMAKWLSESKLKAGFDLVLVSPYVRAQETWQACQQMLLPTRKVMTESDITPYGKSDAVADYLRALIGLEKPQQLLVVSHLPLVGYLTAEFEAGISPPMFATSAIACIDYQPETSVSQLLWIETPSHI